MSSTADHIRSLREDSSEDELDPIPPQLSFNIEESDEDDSFNGPPPQLSMLLDSDVSTHHSIEGPRRAYSEQRHSRILRGSLSSTRLSDRFADVDELQSFDAVVHTESPPLTRYDLALNKLDADVDLG